MVFQDILLDSAKLTELKAEGVLQSFVEHSKVYFDKGTHAYPGVDYTEEEIANSLPELERTEEWLYNEGSATENPSSA